MQKFVDGLKDFIYDSIDYIIMIGIIGLVVLIIGWRLDLLFAKDADDITPDKNTIVANGHNEDEPSNPIQGDEVDELEEGVTDPVDENPEEGSPEPEQPVEAEEPKEPAIDSPNSSTIAITIPAGSNLSNIAGILETNGLISSKSDFISKSEEMQLATKLKAGDFNIKSGSSMEDILKVLTK